MCIRLSILAIVVVVLNLFGTQSVFALYPEPFSDAWELDRKVDDLNSKLDDLRRQIQYAPQAQANQMIWQMGLSALSEEGTCARKLNEDLRAFMQMALEEKKQLYSSPEINGLPYFMQQNLVEMRFGVRMTMLQNLLALRPQALSECIRDSSPQPVAPAVPTKQAVQLPFDVSSGAWYADAVAWLVRQKYLSLRMVFQQGDYVGVPSDFHPNDPATRSEFIRLVVAMYGDGQADAVGESGFDDIDPRNVNEIGYFEQAAKKGWVKGVGSCYGRHPCNVQPNGTLNRAEAAAILVRAMGEQSDNNAPTFKDVSGNAWYAGTIRKAAARCILRGDEGAGTMRPGATMNRGEMAVMLWRASQKLSYPVCQ